MSATLLCDGPGVPGLVTVIIPTYKRADLVCRAVDCALSQSYAHTEVLVVDDGSPDHTEQVIRQRYAGEPRVRYLHKANGGLSSARNAGMRAARGEYIAFLDDDDEWQPWKLAAQVACLRALSAHGVGMIWTNFDKIESDGRLRQASAMWGSYGAYKLLAGRRVFDHDEIYERLAPEAAPALHGVKVHWGDMFSQIVLGNLCLPSTVMVTRERARLIGPFNEGVRVAEDHDYHLRSCRVGPVALFDAPSTRYRVGAQDQLTHPIYGLQFAQNLLSTILPVIQHERARLTLPQALIDEKLAAAYTWVAREMVVRGDNAGARKHILLSLKLRPRQWRNWLLLSSTLVPAAIQMRARALYRRLKSMVRGQPHIA